MCLALNDAKREWLSRAARFANSLLRAFFFFFARMNERRFTQGTARSRAWNLLSRAYAFSSLKCWFGSVFKRNHFSLSHGTLGSGNNLTSLFLQRSASLTRFCNELFKFGASVPLSQL